MDIEKMMEGLHCLEKNYKMRAPRAIWMENLFVIGTCGRWYWAHSWMILCMISDIDYVLNCFVWSGYFSKCIIKAIPSIRFLIKRIFSSWLGDESVLICQGLCGEPDRTTGTPPGSDIFIIWTNGFRDIYYFLSSIIILQDGLHLLEFGPVDIFKLPIILNSELEIHGRCFILLICVTLHWSHVILNFGQ